MKMTFLYALLFFINICSVKTIGRDWDNSRKGSLDFWVEYFSLKEVKAVTSTLCDSKENIVRLIKKFSDKRIGFDWMDLRRFQEQQAVQRLTANISKLGVLVDLSCPRSLELLEAADKNHLFTFSRSLTFWLIVTEIHVTDVMLETLIQNYLPEFRDPLEFLTRAYDDKKNEKILFQINRKVNAEFFRKSFENSEKPQVRRKLDMTNETKLADFLKMNILVDNEISLALPGAGDVIYELFRVFKLTAESKPEIQNVGRVKAGDGNRDCLELNEPKRKASLGGNLLWGASAIFQPEAFTTIDDLSTRESDLWAKISYPHVKHLAEDLDFRPVIRFYDDYGWQTNGTFGHLMGLLQKKKADFSAAALLMRSDRLPVVEFLECPFRLQTGILFREPPLSSVSNIFLLPFSKAIWISIGVVIFLTILLLRFRAMAGKSLCPLDENIASFVDIGAYIVGIVCQQGFSMAPTSLSARASILILLFNSLALFTSYSACIVALLQSSSSAILTVSDITRSNLEVGIQANFPYYVVLMKEATHPVLKEYYKKKVLTKGEKAFCDRKTGIERMRTTMFAFEVELTAGYKLISETYEEREKCEIKEIDFIPKPFICISVRKDSPYKEMFTKRLIWQNEIGLYDRTWKLWVDQKPKCEVSRIGFISVGLTESKPAFWVFVYGICAATVMLSVELIYKRKRDFTTSKNFIRRYYN